MIPVILSIILFILMWLVFYGWGRALCLLLRVQKDQITTSTHYVWTGWAFTLFLVQTIHLLLPVNYLVTTLVAVSGLMLALLFTFAQKNKRISINEMFFWVKKPRSLGIAAILLLATGWLLARSMLPPTHPDSGLYHFNAIRWINSYPVVPGLANLHSRLGFNNSYFSFVALLNFFPYFNHGRSLANSFIFVLTLLTFFPSLYAYVRYPIKMLHRAPFVIFVDLLLLIFLIHLALVTQGLTSPSPDLTSALLQVAIFSLLLKYLLNLPKPQKGLELTPFIIVILAATAISVKLSNLAFGVTTIALLSVCMLLEKKATISRILQLLSLPAAILFIWVIRGFYLSGAPLFPSTIFYVPTDWAMRERGIETLAKWTYSWARQPQVHYNQVLGSWEWLRPWIDRILLLDGEKWIITTPMLTSIFLLLILVFSLFWTKRRNYIDFLPLIVVSCSLTFWFFTAPDPRFASALFILLGIATTLPLIKQADSIPPYLYNLIILVVFLLLSFPYLTYINSNWREASNFSRSGWQPIPTVEMVTKKTLSRLEIYIPRQGSESWDAQLPATPYLNMSLRLRKPGNLNAGFTTKPK